MSKVPEPTSIPQYHTHLTKRGHHVAPPSLGVKGRSGCPAVVFSLTKCLQEEGLPWTGP